MTAIAKSAKVHSAAKKCCGWEEPAIYKGMPYLNFFLEHPCLPIFAFNSFCQLLIT